MVFSIATWNWLKIDANSSRRDAALEHDI